MANGNNISIVGNITRDPELRFTPTGQATATFGVAVNRRWQNRQTQEWEEATSFFDVGVLARDGRERLGEPGPRLSGDRHGTPRATLVGDPGRRQALQVEIVADEIGPSPALGQPPR